MPSAPRRPSSPPPRPSSALARLWLLIGLCSLVPFILPAADGPGLGSQTFPAGTLVHTINGYGGRAIVWHRGWLWVVGNGPIPSSVWNISNPTAPVKMNEAPGSNCHDYIRYGDLMWRDYSASEIGTGGHGLYDLSQLPQFVKFNGPSPKPGFNATDYWGMQWAYPYVNKVQFTDFATLAGINASGHTVLGNLLILYPHNGNDQSGLATFDISDPDNPRLLDVERNAGHQYTTGHHVWKHHFFQIGEPSNVGGGTFQFVGWDFSNPSDLRLSHTLAAWPGRYACFQDEFAFNGSGNGVWKYNLETRELVMNVPAPAEVSDFYWLPIGHLLVGSGDSPRTWIYAHQNGRDTRAPYVNWHWPRPNAVNQHTKSRVGIVINETFDSTTINDNTVILRNVATGQNVNGLVSHTDTGIINFGPVTQLAASTTYELILPANGIKDAAGNGIAETRFRFSTGSTVQGGTTTSGATTSGATTGASATTGGGSTGGVSTGGASTGGSSGSGTTTAGGGTTGTVISWNLGSGNGSAASVPSSAAASGVAASSLTRGSGFAPGESIYVTAGDGHFNYHSGNAPANLAAAQSANHFVEFQVAPQTGKRVSLSQLGFHSYSQDAPVDVTVQYSLNGFSSAGTTVGTAVTASGWNGGLSTIGLSSVAALQNAAGPVTFRLYFHGAFPNGYVDRGLGGTGAASDLVVSGTVSDATGGTTTGSSGTGSTGGTSGSPNVVVTDITWNPASPASGNDVTFSAVVRNSGTAAVAGGTVIGVAFSVDGSNVGWGVDDSSGLAAGASRTIVGNGTGPWVAAAGNHSVAALVDDVNRIVESNESDNTRTESLNIVSVGTGSGLRGDYYTNRDFSGSPALSRTDAIVDFDWGSGSPGTGIGVDQFAVRWSGEVDPPVSGNYVFSTESDDGVRLWINGQQVINNWTDHGATVDSSAPIALTAGTRASVVMEYYEAGGGAVARLRWAQPGGASTAVPIPQDRLFPASGSGTTTGGGTTGTASASLAFTPASPLATGTSVTFTLTAQNMGSGLEYQWEFGDGTVLDWSTANASVSRSYTAPGNYSVVAQVRNGSGVQLSATQPIVVFRSGATPTAASSPIVVDAGRRNVWVANPDADTVTVLNADTLAKVAEIAMDLNPMSVALDGSGQVWVACRDQDSLYVIDAQTRAVIEVLQLSHGAAPVAVVSNPAGTLIYVAESGKGRIQRFNAATRANTGTLAIGPNPRALAVTSDGSRLLVTRFISADSGATVWSVNTSTFNVATAIGIANDTTSPDNSNSARGVANYLAGVAIQPGANVAWVVGKKDNIFRGSFRDGQALTFETSVRSVLSTLNLGNNSETVSGRMDFDNSSQPSAVVASPQGNHVFLTFQGNNELLVLDAFNRGGVARVPTGLAPQGVAVDPNTRRVFVQNFMARTVSIFDGGPILNNGAGALSLIQTVNTVATEKLSPQVLLGKQIFYNAADPRMSRDAYISCAVCHLDGDHDGRTWDFTNRGEGLRNTTSLRGGEGATRGPVHWTGNFDEIQDFEHDIRNAFGGSGFLSDAQFNTGTRNTPLGQTKAGVSADLDALAAYVASLNNAKRSPNRTPEGALTADAAAGQTLFQQLNCAQCHSGSDFSDSALNVFHNVGTIKASSGQRLGQALTGFDTPTLVGLWNTAPYLHDGSAATLRDVLTTANSGNQHGNLSALSSAQIDQLVAFLQQIETGTPNPGGSSTGGTSSGATGAVSREVWTGVGGTAVANIPLTSPPNISDTLTSLEGPINWADSYGTRIRGYIHAPSSGNYTFWIASDDASQLWLSTSDNPASKVKIAEVTQWTGSREWSKFASQKSAAIALTAGQRYYVEILQKEGGGGDNVAVGWAKPNEATTAPSEVVPGAVLSPFTGGAGAAWTGQDVGAVGQAGSFTQTGSTLSVDGGGADIWGTADGFHYVTSNAGLNGDGEIRARLVSQENTDIWAKAGVMIRSDLTAGSAHAFLALTPGNGLAFQWRATAGGSSSHTGAGGVTAPRWLRLVRAGNVFTASHSADGATWTTVGSATITMGASVRVGLAVTSHNDGTLSTATFDDVTVVD